VKGKTDGRRSKTDELTRKVSTLATATTWPARALAGKPRNSRSRGYS